VGVKNTRTARAEGSTITLADLRSIVEQAEGAPGDARVTVREYKSHNPVEHDPAVIEVTWEVAF
jgi:hypothetical protein